MPAPQPTRRELYDALLAPLVDAMAAVCKQHGIACLCLFDVSGPKGDAKGSIAQTSVPDHEGRAPAPIWAAYEAFARSVAGLPPPPPGRGTPPDA